MWRTTHTHTHTHTHTSRIIYRLCIPLVLCTWCIVMYTMMYITGDIGMRWDGHILCLHVVPQAQIFCTHSLSGVNLWENVDLAHPEGAWWKLPVQRPYLPGYLEGSHTFYLASRGSFTIAKSCVSIYNTADLTNNSVWHCKSAKWELLFLPDTAFNPDSFQCTF